MKTLLIILTLKVVLQILLICKTVLTETLTRNSSLLLLKTTDGETDRYVP